MIEIETHFTISRNVTSETSRVADEITTPNASACRYMGSDQ